MPAAFLCVVEGARSRKGETCPVRLCPTLLETFPNARVGGAASSCGDAKRAARISPSEDFKNSVIAVVRSA